MNQELKLTAKSSESVVTASDLARIVRRLSHLYSTGHLGNDSTADAFSHLADFLNSLGSTPVSSLHRQPYSRKRRAPSVKIETYSKASLEEVEAIVSDKRTTKSTLIALARARFGVPESRLKRLPAPEVVDAVRAAVAHEQSLDVISNNAEESGKVRRS